jgi:hypothetical protein
MHRPGIVRTLGPVLLVAAALLVAGPPTAGAAGSPAASAKTDAKLLSVYQNTGGVPPCEFTIAQLSHALKNSDTFDPVYFSDFSNAITVALTQRTEGACSAPSRVQPTVSGLGGPAVGLPGGSVTAPTASAVPLPILILALLALVFGLGAAAVVVVRAQGWDPAWAAAVRHSWGEAGYRLAGAWAEFADWWRSGSEGRGG